MSALLKDECLRELQFAIEESKEYTDLNAFQIIFEANEDTDTANIAEKNKEIKTGVIGHIKKAIAAIRSMIASLINSIADWLKKITMSADEKKMFEDFKEACKKDPDLKNKKITVRDFEQIKKQYEAIIKEAEETDKELAAGKNAEIKGIINKCTAFVKDVGKAIAKDIGIQTALNAAHMNRGYANIISMATKADSRILDGIESSFGAKEAEKFQKEVSTYTNRCLLRRAILKVRGKMFKNTVECFTDSINGAKDVIGAAESLGGKAKMIGNKTATDMALRMTKNQNLKDTYQAYKDINKDLKKGERRAKVDAAKSKITNKVGDIEGKIKNKEMKSGNMTNAGFSDMLGNEIEGIKGIFKKKK